MCSVLGFPRDNVGQTRLKHTHTHLVYENVAYASLLECVAHRILDGETTSD